MKFAHHHLAEEFRQRLHPAVREVLEGLDLWLHAEGLPEVTVTHVLRTPEQQEGIYWRRIAREEGLAEKAARAKARKKFSWHLVGCAADIRNHLYSAGELLRVVRELRRGRDAPEWEVLSHDVGRGTHLHVGRRDAARRGGL